MLEVPAHGAPESDRRKPAHGKRAERARQRLDRLMTGLAATGFPPDAAREVVTLQDEKRRSVYRVRVTGRPYDTLIAKRAPTAEALREVPFYTRVVAALGLPALAMYGAVEDAEHAETWLFIEDAAGEPYDRNDPRHAELAGSWMGRFHAAGATTPLPELVLRDRGPVHFGAHVVAAGLELERNGGNPALGRDDVELVHALLGLVRSLEAEWPEVVTFMAQFPATFVHGDFKPDNLRIRSNAGGADLVVFDWNEAGRGVPALDWSRFLVSMNSVDGTAGTAPRGGAPSIHRLAPNLDTYLDAVRPVWPHLDRETVQRLGLFGELFHCAASVRWESARLAYSWIDGPVANLGFFRIWLEELMAELGL
jgi:Ser/Thr protein kinase RdoA (MazF antagonist)